MSPIDTTPKDQTDSLSIEVDLPHPPEKVWRALTEPDLMSQWLVPVLGHKLTLEAGASFTLKTQPQPNWDGTVRCLITDVEPHRKLSYTWVAGTESEIDTVVSFTLTPSDSGTHLRIDQSGFKPHQKQALGGARYGWRMMSERLEGVVSQLF